MAVMCTMRDEDTFIRCCCWSRVGKSKHDSIFISTNDNYLHQKMAFEWFCVWIKRESEWKNFICQLHSTSSTEKLNNIKCMRINVTKERSMLWFYHTHTPCHLNMLTLSWIVSSICSGR